jgi:hypothetical protein
VSAGSPSGAGKSYACRVMRALFLALALVLPAAAQASVGEVWQRVQWGERDDALARAFGGRATVLDRPIEYGDTAVHVVLRDVTLGGHNFAVYFQSDGAGLRRIHFERPRHGAVLGIWRDVVAALEDELGRPSSACDIPRQRTTGYQAERVRLWRRDRGTVRAVFRDTSIQSSEGCLAEERSGSSPCGLTGQIFVQITRDDPGCGASP